MRLSYRFAVGIITFAHAQRYFSTIRALICDCSRGSSKNSLSTIATEHARATCEAHRTYLLLLLQRYVSVLLWRVFVTLGFKHFERLDQLLTCLTWLDDGINVSALRSNIGIGHTLP